MGKLLITLLFPLLLVGCGRKGALVPPEAMVPAPITDLRVVQKGEAFQVSWSRPARDDAGAQLRDLAGFRVFRRQVLPAGQDCEQCPDAYRLVREIDPEYLRGAAQVGDRYAFQDADVRAGETYQYKAFSFKRDGSTSRESNKPRRTMVAPPPAPEVKAQSFPDRVELSWDTPPLPAGVVLTGYDVYRRPAAPGSPLLILNDAPLKEPRFADRRLDPHVSYRYAVRTLVRIGGETVESRPSSDVNATLASQESEQ